MASQVEIISNAMDTCGKPYLEDVFKSLTDSALPDSSSKAEIISHCLNKELGGYGIKTYPSPDRTTVLIDGEGVTKVVDFFNGKSYQPYITNEHLNRVETIVKYADKNAVSIIWEQKRLAKVYYSVKQFGFNGANLWNLLSTNTMNVAAASLSPTGAASFSMAGLVAISWSGSLFLSTLESYVPNNYTILKAGLSGTKFIVALPIRCVEWTVNQGFNWIERRLTGYSLPINTTDVYKLNEGPNLKQLGEFRKPLADWIIRNVERWRNG